ncbi:fumarylacetoacetate hydrolase family protein [Muricoccus aerilatus]|uniref:fumarylacetoacetate hydrolase family protein n=1 Tax=Muricoccus aerilatus TaxID=452982 RepID=UPI0005C24174|nr:fumarylacetoacetate hydrolase family protein [Roseomonas aerilata]
MRFATFRRGDSTGLAAAAPGGGFHGLLATDANFPGTLDSLVAAGPEALKAAGQALLSAPAVSLESVELLPPLTNPGKIICVGLNYADHSAESGFAVPSYPTIFARFTSSLIGHGAPILRPVVSEQLDFEGEFVAVIGRGGRHIAKDAALDHVIGYSVFNDASVRDFQLKAPQWTVGKNFDSTGAFGPTLVTADEVPPGARGLRIETRLNGQVVQSASTDSLIFDVATLISTLSEAFTLSAGDIIVTGTPAGVGLARKPPLWMKPGDVCEVEVEGLGILSNPIKDEAAVGQRAAA